MTLVFCTKRSLLRCLEKHTESSTRTLLTAWTNASSSNLFRAAARVFSGNVPFFFRGELLFFLFFPEFLFISRFAISRFRFAGEDPGPKNRIGRNRIDLTFSWGLRLLLKDANGKRFCLLGLLMFTYVGTTQTNSSLCQLQPGSAWMRGTMPKLVRGWQISGSLLDCKRPRRGRRPFDRRWKLWKV